MQLNYRIYTYKELREIDSDQMKKAQEIIDLLNGHAKVSTQMFDLYHNIKGWYIGIASEHESLLAKHKICSERQAFFCVKVDSEELARRVMEWFIEKGCFYNDSSSEDKGDPKKYVYLFYEGYNFF